MAGTTGPEDLARAHAETRAAFETRARMYRYIYEELSAEFGSERAAEVMKRAIRRHGLEVGRKYREAAAAGDLAAVAEIFCGGSPCGGDLFGPGVESAEGDTLVLRMTGCPLVEAWRADGVPADEVEALCEIAAEVDEGTFEAAGLDLTFLERAGSPGASRCLLSLRGRPHG